jgi:hypothetical protein
MPTTMTEEDLKAAPALADQIIALVTTNRPPTAVAAVALALAATAHLAECGPNAARKLFESYYDNLARAQGSPTIAELED